MRRGIIFGVIGVLIAVAIIVPIVLFVNKDEVGCYPKFDGTESCYAKSKATAYRWYGPKTDYTISTGLNGSDAKEVKFPGTDFTAGLIRNSMQHSYSE